MPRMLCKVRVRKRMVTWTALISHLILMDQKIRKVQTRDWYCKFLLTVLRSPCSWNIVVLDWKK